MNNVNNEDKELFLHMKNVVDFKNMLNDISKTWDQLILFSQLGSTGIDMSHTKDNFNNLTEELAQYLGDSTMDKVVKEMSSKSQVAVDIVIRNLFERTADIGFLATDDDIRHFLVQRKSNTNKIELHKNDQDDTQFRILKQENKKSLHLIKERFNEYVAKYSVYYDIILFNRNGDIVVNLDESNTIKTTSDELFEIAKNTKEDYVETYKYHDFLPHHKKSLVYTYKVTETNESDKIIGYLSLCFKFENEMEGIFSRLVNKKNKETILLLDKECEAIASSDKYHIPLGAKLDIELDKPFNITSFAGRDYIIKTCVTNGYEGFHGLGWMGHIMIPLSSAFLSNKKDIEVAQRILHSIMKNENIFKKELYKIPQKAVKIQNELDRAVWNGNVSQTDKASSGNVDFTRSILREVRETGEKTKSSFNTSITKLNQTIISSLLDNAIFLSSLSIDIMDRNLYERANDCRWWALTSSFRKILEKDIIDEDEQSEITNILKYINELYTVYTNIFVYDKNGKIIAVSNNSELKLVGRVLLDNWIKKTLELENSSKYSVSSFEKSELYNNKHTYIYGAAIFGDSSSKVVGGIGIVFDSELQFKDMINDALPELNNTMFSLFVERNSKKIVSCSNNDYIVGELINIDDSFFQLEQGKSKSEIIEFKNKYYIVGATSSLGYREYKSKEDDYKNDIIALVFIEAGDILENKEHSGIVKTEYYQYPISNNDEIKEIATFYIGDKWIGIEQDIIIEAISFESMETPMSMEKEKYLKGMMAHKDYIVSVLDISEFIKNEKHLELSDIIVINYDGSDGKHTLGIAISQLGEIMKIPVTAIKDFDSQLISGGMIAQSIVHPPLGTESNKLLTLLNIKKLQQMAK